MKPVLFETTETAFTSYGLGTLEPISCFVEEERNGSYELTMTASITGQHSDEISVGRFILAKPNRTDDPQPFRIYETEKTLDGRLTVYARHISYDLSGIVLSAFTRYDCGTALQGIEDRCAGWSFQTDRSAQAGRFSTGSPASARAWLGGRAGSILDLYGPGEWHFDKYTCSFLTARGANRGVVIRYGKNLTALKAEADSTNVASKVQCYYADTNGTVVRGSAVATGQTAITRTLLVDVTDKYETVPSAADLTAEANSYITSHNVTTPKANITLDWVQSGEIIDRVDLCDTVTIRYDDFGVSGTAKCIRTKWNVLLDRYEEIEVGDVKTTLADTLASTDEKITTAMEETASAYQQAIAAASNIITGAAGGYVVFWNSTTQAPGTPNDPANEILVMDTDDVATATKVWRWNINGLGYSSNGYVGPYQTAIDMNGGIATWFIDTVRINADNITAGTLTGRTINNGTGTFYVDANGNVTAKAGTIGGWKLGTNILEKYSDYTAGTPTTVYRAFLSAPSHPGSNYLAFGVEVYDWDGSTLTLNSQPFRVRYDGGFTATSGNLTGEFHITDTNGNWGIFGANGLTYGLQGNATAKGAVTITPAGLLSISGTDGITIPSSVNFGMAPKVANHSSAVGSVQTARLTSDTAVTTSQTSCTSVASLSLTAGTWLIFGYVLFGGTSSASRRVATISNTSGAYNAYIRNDSQVNTTNATALEVSGISVLGSTTTMYLNASSSVSCNAIADATFIQAIRIL